jgi:Glycoside hydrolase 123 N-terminal domain/Glycoside hydrolase 123, catalytic domain
MFFIRKFLFIISILCPIAYLNIFATSSYAGEITFRITKDSTDNINISNDFSWDLTGEWANLTTNPYRLIFNGLDTLPGTNKKVIAAEMWYWLRYESPGTTTTYTLDFYNGRDFTTSLIQHDFPGRDVGVAGTYNGLGNALYRKYVIPTPKVQEWIDSPGSNVGLSIARTGGNSTLVFGSIHNQVAEKTPVLEITYTYDGEIAPPKPILTKPVANWQCFGDVVIEWIWPSHIDFNTSFATIQIEYRSPGGDWVLVANNLNGSAGTYTWDTSGIDTGQYELRIRSEQNDQDIYASAWEELEGSLTLTSDAFSIVQVNNMIKVKPIDRPTPYNYAIFGGRGEVVSGQYVLVPHTNLTNVEVRLSDFTKGADTIPAELFAQEYREVIEPSGLAGTIGTYPDALIPIIDSKYGQARKYANIDIDNYSNFPLWIDATIPLGQAPGEYTAKLTVVVDSVLQHTEVVNLTVYNYSLPQTSSYPTWFGLDTLRFNGIHPGTSNEVHAVYRHFLLDHRISVSSGGTGSYFYTEYDEQNSTASISSTGTEAAYDWQLAGDKVNDNLLTVVNGALYIKSDSEDSNRAREAGYLAIHDYAVNKGWDNILFSKIYDEPHTPEAYAQACANANLVKAKTNIPTMITKTPRPELVDVCGNHIDIWTVAISQVDDENNYGGRHIQAQIDIGDDIWLYTAMDSQWNPNLPGYFVDYPTGVYARVHTWIMEKKGFVGLHYYEVAESTKQSGGDVQKAWDNIYYFTSQGDGTIIYPGEPSIIGGNDWIPIASIRMKYIRDSLYDLEYFKLLKQSGYGDFVNNLVSSVVTDSVNWKNDPDLLMAAKRAMAQTLNELPSTPLIKVMIQN